MSLKRRGVKAMAAALAVMLMFSMTACSQNAADTGTDVPESTEQAADYLSKEDITVNETLENSADGGVYSRSMCQSHLFKNSQVFPVSIF